MIDFQIKLNFFTKLNMLIQTSSICGCNMSPYKQMLLSKTGFLDPPPIVDKVFSQFNSKNGKAEQKVGIFGRSLAYQGWPKILTAWVDIKKSAMELTKD